MLSLQHQGLHTDSPVKAASSQRFCKVCGLSQVFPEFVPWHFTEIKHLADLVRHGDLRWLRLVQSDRFEARRISLCHQ